jgi:hypothetical protein
VKSAFQRDPPVGDGAYRSDVAYTQIDQVELPRCTFTQQSVRSRLTDHSWIEHTSSGLHFGVFALLLVRFGLLAAVVQFYVWGLFVFFPMTANLAAWYAGAGVTALLVVAALTAWGATAAFGRSRAVSPR